MPECSRLTVLDSMVRIEIHATHLRMLEAVALANHAALRWLIAPDATYCLRGAAQRCGRREVISAMADIALSIPAMAVVALDVDGALATLRCRSESLDRECLYALTGRGWQLNSVRDATTPAFCGMNQDPSGLEAHSGS